MNARIRFTALIAVLLLLPACITDPVTGKSQIGIDMSEKEEIRLGSYDMIEIYQVNFFVFKIVESFSLFVESVRRFENLLDRIVEIVTVLAQRFLT